jgi:hypothetical protein
MESSTSANPTANEKKVELTEEAEDDGQRLRTRHHFFL